MKKIKFIILLIIALSFTFSFKSVTVNASNKQIVDINAYSAYLMDYNSNTVIFSYNENERKPIASMTKIALLLLAYENVEKGNLSLNQNITVSKNASGMGGSQVFLEENGVYSVDTLLKSITVASANDASVAIAERLYGSEKECVNAMNNKVKELKLQNTLFANCTGLPAPMQYSSAKDIAILFSNLIKYENYFKYSTVWMDKVAHSKNETEISNTNKLLKRYEGCDGGKTGYTSEAGFCLTATAKRGNMRLIASVLNAPTSNDRFESVSNMLNYGFSNYTNKCIVDNDIPFDSKLNVRNSKQKEIEIVSEKDCYIFSKRNEKEIIDSKIDLYEVKAPILKGDIVGQITVYKNGVEACKSNIIANENADKMSYFDYVKELFENWT